MIGNRKTVPITGFHGVTGAVEYGHYRFDFVYRKSIEEPLVRIVIPAPKLNRLSRLGLVIRTVLGIKKGA